MFIARSYPKKRLNVKFYSNIDYNSWNLLLIIIDILLSLQCYTENANGKNKSTTDK